MSDETLEMLTAAMRRFAREELIPAEAQVEALRTPEVGERIRAQAYDVWTLGPDEFAAFLRADYAKWGKVVRVSGAKAD
jgi:tripartite-type tricarboxylate transporter receptor subunit TctC